jgi:chromosomal replication initiator protein
VLRDRGVFDPNDWRCDSEVRVMDAPSEPGDWKWLQVRKIQSVVATYYGLPFAEMRGPKRNNTVSRARMMACGIARELTKQSFPKLGQLFGGRDHSTILNACRRFEALRQAKDPDVEKLLERCARALEPIPKPPVEAPAGDRFVAELVAAGVRKPER